MALTSDRWLLRVMAYSGVVCLMAATVAQNATLLIDGNTYFEMAQQMVEHGSFEVPNGLEVTQSAELWLGNTIRIDGRLVSKYPPLYALLAAPFYLFFGLHGLIGLNILGLGLIVVGFFLLARRCMEDQQAFVFTVALPFVTPLFAYAVIVMPHLVAAALVLWSIVFFHHAITADSPRPAFTAALLCGLLGGFSMGVRVQDLIPMVVLLATVPFHARFKRSASLGLLAGLAPCLLGLSAINAARFGTFNPITYGPAGYQGSPIRSESIGFLAQRPGTLILIVIVTALLALFALTRSHPRSRLFRLGGLALALLAVALVPVIRSDTLQLLRSTIGLLADATLLTRGFADPITFHGLAYKSLLQASPLLGLGLGAALWYGLKNESPLLFTLGRICILAIGFLATRHLEVGQVGNVLGIAAFGTRYLVECYALLFLLACALVVRLPWERTPLLLGALAGFGLFWLIAWTRPTHNPLAKRLLILYGSLLLAALLPLALLVWRRWGRPAFLVILLAIGSLYAAAVTVTQDTRHVTGVMGVHRSWMDHLERVLPPRLVLVGWGGGMHGIYPIRERRQVTMVDASHDNGRDLLRVLHAFHKKNIPLYYFGIGLPRVRPKIERDFKITRILHNPMLWKLERRMR